MFLQLLFLFFILILLFLISKRTTNFIYYLFFLLTQSKNISISILSLILLTGTMVHELSHFLLASILRVPTGDLSVIPSIDEKTGEVKAGKLMLGKSDPFRHTVIGLAPTIVGTFLIYLIGKLFFPQLTIIGSYLLFVVSTTMFSSRKDMESLKIALPIAILIILALYFIGIRVSLTSTMMVKVESFLKELNGYLLISAILDFTIWVFLVLNLKLWQKLLRREVKTG